VLRVERIVGLTSGNNLINFSSGMPGTLASKVPVTGLIQGEALLGIEYRPSDQKIYGVTSISRMVTINPVTGTATPIGIQLTVPVFGLQTGLDVNPVVDRMRLVNSNRQNLRLNMSTGQIAGVDSPLIYVQGDPNAQATPSVVAAAYTNNIAGATSTSLYGIDVNLNTLVLQGSLGGTPISPNTGVMSTVGNLGVDAVGNIGFEIAPFTNAAFAAMTPNGSATSNLYTINLNTGVATMVGMIGGGETLTDITIVPRVESIYAVTASNRLISFNSTQPGVILSSVQISGLSGNAVGFDFRPANGQAYALDSNGRVYTVNLTTGAATAVGANPATTLAGTQFGVDFNAIPDRIRVVSNTGQDLRLNPNDGTLTATDGGLAYAATDVRATQPASVVAAAYNDSFAGTTSTTLYGLDSNYGTLVRQGSPGGAPVSPNLGTLFTIGSLGVTVDSVDSFDIANFTNRAYGSFTTGGISQLYRIDLITGAATLVGSIGGGEQIRGIAIVNAPSGVVQPVRTLAATNAASFSTAGVAPSSLVSIFGQFLTNNGQTFIANSQPLPVSLGGVSVTVNGMNAQLLAVTPTQINLMMPATAILGTAPQSLGTATMVVNNSDGSINMGTTALVRSAVGIFTANGSGSGTAAALTTTDGVTFQSTINPDGSARGISAGTAATPNFLVLYTTGISLAPAAIPGDGNGVAEAVTIMIGNAPATVTFAGPAPGLSGVEQVNVMIPPQLAGAGTVPITMTVDGRISNLPTVLISQ
ncbi:MAG TPA: DUF4394 domain-containing protein, partial [Blastocatellia bacterium]|nr:DUF4394 domain-containing protein [Blastocatellia bacterium]